MESHVDVWLREQDAERIEVAYEGRCATGALSEGADGCWRGGAAAWRKQLLRFTVVQRELERRPVGRVAPTRGRESECVCVCVRERERERAPTGWVKGVDSRG